VVRDRFRRPSKTPATKRSRQEAAELLARIPPISRPIDLVVLDLRLRTRPASISCGRSASWEEGKLPVLISAARSRAPTKWRGSAAARRRLRERVQRGAHILPRWRRTSFRQLQPGGQPARRVGIPIQYRFANRSPPRSR